MGQHDRIMRLSIGPMEYATMHLNPQDNPQIDMSAVYHYWYNIICWFVTTHGRDLNTLQVFEKNYPFGIHEIRGGSVDDDGTLRYPEDPAMIPLIRIDRYEETTWLYQSEIAAVVKADGTTFVTRLD